MLDIIKTSNGAYYLTLTIAIIVWFFGGIGVFAGYHLNRVRGIESSAKAAAAKAAEDDIRAKAAELQSKLDATTKELEETKAKTLTHDDILSYRAIKAEQKKLFLDGIKDAPKGAVKVWAVTNNDEAFQYAKAISTMLAEGGYQTGRVVNSWMSATPQEGIIAAVATQESITEYRSSFVAALMESGIKLRSIIGHPVATNQPEFIHIIVGGKPR